MVTLTLTSSVNPSLVGQAVTFTVQVSSPDGTHPGPVVLTDQSANTPLATLTPDASGHAAFTTSALSAGQHLVYATYNGDTLHSTASAVVVQQVVSGYTTTMTLAGVPNPAAVGQTVTFVAGVATTSGGMPTGSMQFAEGTTVLATLPLTTGGLSSARVDFSTSTLAVGSHTISATYVPTGSFAGSSATVVEVITGKASATTLGATPNPALALGTVVLRAGVTGAGGVAPTGTVTFTDGGAAIGMAAVSASGAAVLSASFAAGSHSLVAMYGGDGVFGASSSAAVVEVVGANATATSLVVSPTTGAMAYSAITLSARTVAPGVSASPAYCAPGCVAPTVRFLANGAVVASAAVAADGECDGDGDAAGGELLAGGGLWGDAILCGECVARGAGGGGAGGGDVWGERGAEPGISE